MATRPDGPVIIGRDRHHFVMAGPEHKLRPALDGETSVVIEDGRCAGDRVYAGAKQQYGPYGWVAYQIADETDHPEHGHLLYVHIAEYRLDEAPQLRAIAAKAFVDGVRARQKPRTGPARLFRHATTAAAAACACR